MGNLIYQPKGKAKEYGTWACNLFLGCSNRCDYCYNRHGLGASILGKCTVTWKVNASVEQFEKELLIRKDQIIKDGKGLFFSFVSDPFLNETYSLNRKCAIVALNNSVPCVFLSKRIPPDSFVEIFRNHPDLVKVGFSLTGCDELEHSLSTNSDRIKEIKMLNRAGVKTWASIEPVIDIAKSVSMIQQAYIAGCREFKIGLLSGKRQYTPSEVAEFKDCIDMAYGEYCNIYWKTSVIEYIEREK